MRVHSAASFLFATFATLTLSACSNNNAPIKSPQWNSSFTDSLARDFLGMRQQQDGDVVMAWHHQGQLHYRRVNDGAVQAQDAHAMSEPGIGVTGAYAMADDATLVDTGGREFFHFAADDTLQHRIRWNDLGYPNVTLVAAAGDRICFTGDSSGIVHLRCIHPDGELIWESELPGVTRALHLRHGDLDRQARLTFSYAVNNDWQVLAFDSDGTPLWQWSETQESRPSLQAIESVGDTRVVSANVTGADAVVRTQFLHFNAQGSLERRHTLEREIEYVQLQAFDHSSYLQMEENRLSGKVFMSRVGVNGTQQWQKEVPAGGVGMGSGGLHMMGARLDGSGNILILHNVRSAVPALVRGVLGLNVVDNFSVSRYNGQGTLVQQDVISRSRYKVGELGQIFDADFGFSAFDFVAGDGQYFVAAGEFPPDHDPEQPWADALLPSLKAYNY